MDQFHLNMFPRISPIFPLFKWQVNLCLCFVSTEQLIQVLLVMTALSINTSQPAMWHVSGWSSVQ